jgi:ATP-dependent helicase/nuclease subunit B
MMRPLFDIASLKDDIEAGALILTSNNRLATKIRQAWGHHQQQNGNTIWPNPEVHAIEHWLNECWLRCCDSGAKSALAGTIVSRQIEQMLWEQIIDEDTEKPDNLLPASFSLLAQNSYNITQRWQIPLSRLKHESSLLHRWSQAFRHKLKKYSLVTSADSTLTVLEAYKNETLPQLSRIVTVGFDSIPPLYQSVIQSASAETTQHQVTEKQLQAHIKRTQFHDEEQELMAVAAWADQKQLANPTHRIGIVIPELARTRPQVERIFRQQLEPDYQHPNQPRSAPRFNISAGIPLSTTPMVASALLLLSLNRRQLPLEDFCRLLNLPFWGKEQSLEKDEVKNEAPTDSHSLEGCSLIVRAITEKRLRKLARPQLSGVEFRYQLHLAEQFLDRDNTNQNPAFNPNINLSTSLEQSESLRRDMPKKASFHAWLLLFQQQLDLLGWPGQRPLDSIEYQQYQHWLQTLDQYHALDQLNITITLHDALRQLQQLTEHCIFQAETNDAPIQILGLLESSALRFDHLWVVGMDNQHWPQGIAPNPLLSINLQREYQTPRAIPERELQLAQNQIAGLKAAADDVIFSFSEFDSARLRQASTLIANIPEECSDKIISAEPFNLKQTEREQAELEQVPCEYGPALDLNKEAVRGGSSIFRDQATCPFNAFARHRLGAEKLPEPQLGLSSMDRGSLVHDCLEQVWQQLGCQQQLLDLSDTALSELIDSTVSTALQRWKKQRPDLFGPRFTAIEKQRLTKLIQQWLALEKTRPNFTVVAFEERTETSFAGLPLRLIIDRIDQLEDGRQVIIDYKTGKAKTNSWLGDRPEQPQLPLYVLCSETPVAAATFAVINVSQQQFVGFSESHNLLPDVQPPGKRSEPESWDELLTQWQSSLTLLGQEFQQAYAAVKLYKPAAKQFQQELEPLNRLPELSMDQSTTRPMPKGALKP